MNCIRFGCWTDTFLCLMQVLVGCSNGEVKTFSTEKGLFTETRQCGQSDEGKFTGLAVTDRYHAVLCLLMALIAVLKNLRDARP